MKLPSPGVRELQPRVSQELGESMFLVLCGGDCARVSGHMHLSLEETWAEKRDLGAHCITLVFKFPSC